MTADQHKRAVLPVAAAAREVADAAYTLVFNLGEEASSRERIKA